MRKLFRWISAILILSGLGGGGFYGSSQYIKERNKPNWRFQEVLEGDLVMSVNATGKVEPTKKVAIGAFVSGPVQDIYVDFNAKVIENQLLARIDPRLYEAAMRRDQAILKTREAEVERADALLQQAKNDEKRSLELLKANPDFISQTEMDQQRFNRMAREAEISVAQSNVAQARAQLENSQANMAYTEIRSPVDGIITNRKVDPGQTLAAQFQTPEMFIVAPEMDVRMHIYASVDEADIGLIKKAQLEVQPVRFTVDAYPNELFEEGKITQVRLSSTESQNVITYPVIVETPNREVKLLPGMTANLSFQIEAKTGVIKVPNAALRYYPDKKRVHPSDHAILDGTAELEKQAENGGTSNQSAIEKAESNRMRNRRHIWVVDGELLRAKEVTLGISDSRYTELLSGEIKVGDQLVVGEQPKKM